MEPLTTINTLPAAELGPSLFDQFISYIDRGEKTTQTYVINLRQFAAWLKLSGIKRPVRSDVIAYRDYLAAEHKQIKLDPTAPAGWSYKLDGSGNPVFIACKPNTIAQYLRSVSRFFRWTASNGLYPNIAENIHAPKIAAGVHRKEALTASDVLAIETSINAQAQQSLATAALSRKDTTGRIFRSNEQSKRLYAMYLLAVNAGLRTIELERANVKDIEVRNGNAVMYVYGKGHTEADTRKPLAPEVYDAIRDYLNSRSDRPTASSPLFVSTGNRSKGQRIAARTISQMLKNAMKNAGYDSERITAHSLRHTAGTAVMQLSGDVYITQKYMRHMSPTTTEIYLHVETEKQEADIAKRLYGYYHGMAGDNTK